MGHPAVENRTSFATETVFVANEQGQSLLVLVIKATYMIAESATLTRAEKQIPVNLTGTYWADPQKSSYKYEPETAFIKPATDVVLIGHAHAPSAATRRMEVGLRVGPVQKIVTVVGDRVLFRRLGQVYVADPAPFERIPLVYERAFGGWDRRDADPDKHRFEQRNPVGVGFSEGALSNDEQLRLPNLEDVGHPYRRYGDTPPPAGFGFIAPHWQPRARLGGTYDAQWDRERKPLLPKDFDRRFFNAASVGLIAPGYLIGNEPVVVVGASREGRADFHLPGVPPPLCGVELRGRKRALLETVLDTVIVNMDDRLLFLTWRGHVPVRNGPHDVLSIEIGTSETSMVPH